MEKKRVIAIAIVGALTITFLGVSAWRYFTVVVPQQSSAEQSQEQENLAAGDTDAAETVEATPEDTKHDDETQYSGKEAELFAALKNNQWVSSSGESYLSFPSNSTAKFGNVASSAEEKEFEILTVEGNLDSADGCTAIARIGDDYGTLLFKDRKHARDGQDWEQGVNFKIYSPVICLEGMKDCPDKEVKVTGYEQGLPYELEENREKLDFFVEKTVRAELPAAGTATWSKKAEYSYDESGLLSIKTAYTVDDGRFTKVEITFKPSTGELRASVKSAEVEETGNTAVAPGSGETGQKTDEEGPSQEEIEQALADPNAVVNASDDGSGSVTISQREQG